MDRDDWQKKFREGFSGSGELKEFPKTEDSLEETPKEKFERLRKLREKAQAAGRYADGGTIDMNMLNNIIGGQAQQEPSNYVEAPQQMNLPPIDVTAEDEAKAKIAQMNEDMKSPAQKEKPEIIEDTIKQEAKKTPIGQAMEDRAPASPQDDMLAKYKKAIAAYEDKVNAPEKEYGVMDALPDILTGLYNIGARAKGNVLSDMKMPNSIEKRRAQDSAARKESASGLQNLQNMYAKYMELQSKGKGEQLSALDQAKIGTEKAKAKLYETKSQKPVQKITEGQKAVDKDYAKEYNKFTASGMNNAANAIEKLKNLQKSVAKDTGFGEAGGTRLPIPDMFRSRLAIERRDDARNFANVTLKELFGGQLSDAEREAAAREYWNDELDNESNAKRLANKIQELEDNLIIQKQKADYYETNGTLKGFKSAPKETKEVRRKTKDGRTAIFNADTKEFIKYE